MQRFPTYGNLVQHENDLVGLVAYSLYKQDKFAFVKDHNSSSDVEPNDGDMENFCRASNLPNRLASYRESAEKLLSRMNSELLESTITQIKDEFEEELIEHVKKFREPSLTWHVMTHAFAAVIVWAVVTLFIFLGIVAVRGLPSTINSLTGWTIQGPAQKP